MSLHLVFIGIVPETANMIVSLRSFLVVWIVILSSLILLLLLLLGKDKVKIAHTWLPSIGFRSWSWFWAVSQQVICVINPAVGCHYHYFPPGLQLPPQTLRGMLPILLIGEQRHNGCEQFAWDCYPTASRLRFEPGSFCAWVQHANQWATEPPSLIQPCYYVDRFHKAVVWCLSVSSSCLFLMSLQVWLIGNLPELSFALCT